MTGPTNPAWFWSFRAVSLLVLLPSLAMAQPALKTLVGHVPEAVRHLVAKENLPDTNRLNLAIGLPLRDSAGLDDFLKRVYDPAGTNYHRYLTPEQFTARFGPTEADYALVEDFAQRNHLSVTARHANRLLLDVSGSVADIQKAFHLTLRVYAHPTEARDFFAPDTEPSVEVSLPIADIGGLNNYVLPHPKSLHLDTRPAGAANPRTGSGAGNTYFGNDFRAAYLPGVTLTGSGQTVGLVEFDGFYTSDITAYETAAGLPAVPLQTILLDGYNGTPTTGANSGNPEVSLDIEMALAMAPGLAKIVSFEAGPNGLQNDVLNSMAANTQIKQFSCSWGWGGGPSTTTDTIFKEMDAQGQSFFNASGDSDAFTVGATSANGVDNPALDNAPSSNPYITEVGGTTLTTTGPGGSWSSETAWNWGLDKGSYVGTSGGVSSYYSIPAWQAGVNMTANGGSTAFRNTPDVALTADNVYVGYGNGTSGSFGGTSCATPLWAALAALMNQQAAIAAQPAIGFINPAIYAVGNGAAYNSCFHDITTGNNFSANSPNNYSAVAGYDLCTGWGTPSGQGIINALTGPPDPLGITPSAGFTATGASGGPFSPATEIFVLTNNGASSLNWSVNLPAWLSATPNSGALAGGTTANVTVGFNAAASNLVNGAYAADVTFYDLTSGAAQSLLFNLQIGQSLVQNGGFETGGFTGWTFVGDTVVSRTIYDGVETSSFKYSVVHSGSFGAALGDTKLATLSQTLATVPGQAYLVSFWLDNPVAGSGEQFLVNWTAGGVTNTLYNVVNPPAFSWTNVQVLASAVSAATVLQFGVENNPAYFGLDDISVTPVPTPRFQSATRSANGFTLAWNSGGGLNYQVQYTTSLSPANWINLGAPIAATGGLLTFSDTNAIPASAQRFYRLVISQ